MAAAPVERGELLALEALQRVAFGREAAREQQGLDPMAVVGSALRQPSGSWRTDIAAAAKLRSETACSSTGRATESNLMKPFLPVLVAGVLAAHFAHAGAEVPYGAFAAPMKLAKPGIVNGKPARQLHLRFKDPAQSDVEKARFRIKTSAGEIIPLRVAALPQPATMDGAEFTHELWLPSDTKAFQDATLLHDLPRGSVVVEVSIPAKATAKKPDAGAKKQIRALAQELVNAENVFGAEHMEALLLERKLAEVLEDFGAAEAAEPLARHAATGFTKKLGADHKDARDASKLLALTLMSLDRHTEAEEIVRSQVGIEERVSGADGPEATLMVMALADCLVRQKKFEEAEAIARRVITRPVVDDPISKTCVITAHMALAKISSEQKNSAEAVAHSRHAVQLAETQFGKAHEHTIAAKLSLGASLMKVDEKETAAAIARDVMALTDKSESSDNRHWLEAKELLAETEK